MEQRSNTKRIFTNFEKEVCWQRVNKKIFKAPILIGRNPDRWRLDAVGNPVLKSLKFCDGPLCYQYDHIVPHSKGGDTHVDNCQLLQSTLNKVKSNRTDITYQELKQISPNHIFSNQDMDNIEKAIYGDVLDFDLGKIITNNSKIYQKNT